MEDLQDPADLAEWPSIRVSTFCTKDRYIGIFNTQTVEKSLRQALAYAIDKSRWPNRAFGPLAPTSWAYNSDVKPYDLDLGRAKQLLAKVGKRPDKIVLHHSFRISPGRRSRQKRLASFGYPYRNPGRPEVTTDFTALIIGQKIPIDPDQIFSLALYPGNQCFSFQSSRADKLLEDGRKTLDQQTPQKHLSRISKIHQRRTARHLPLPPTTYFISRI